MRCRSLFFAEMLHFVQHDSASRRLTKRLCAVLLITNRQGTSMDLVLTDLLEQPEGQQLAFTGGKFRSEELAETLAALANAQGGMVVVGASGRGKKIEGLGDLNAA